MGIDKTPMYHLRGALKDIGANRAFSGATLELWKKGSIYDALLSTTISKEEGKFCFQIVEADLFPNSGQDSQEGCPELFFVKVSYDGAQYANNVSLSEDDWTEIAPLFNIEGESTFLWVYFRQDAGTLETNTLSFKMESTVSHNPLKNKRFILQPMFDGEPRFNSSLLGSNGQGYVTYRFTTTDEMSGVAYQSTTYSIRFSLLKEENDDVVSTAEVDVTELDTHRYRTITVAMVSPDIDDQSETIDQLETEIGLTISIEVKNFLISHAIESLKDLRAHGFANPELFPDEEDKITVDRLNAHARLELAASGSPKLRDHYINIGFKSLQQVAKVARSKFVQQGAEFLESNELEKATFHRVAQAQHKVLLNVLAGAKIGVRTVANNDRFKEQLGPEHEAYCNCKDCEAAVSPLAYLSDLLRYTTEHVTIETSPGVSNYVTIPQLEDLFHQPFGDLPADCAEMDKQICQYRIAVEILRQHLADTSPTDCQTTNKDRSEERYRNSAYFMLLELLGTSYDEMRRAQAVPLENRKEKLQSLVDRLGICLDFSMEITAVPNNTSIKVSGDFHLEFARAGRFTISRSSGNDGTYTVSTVTPPTYNSTTKLTTVTIADTFPNTTVAGFALLNTIDLLFLDVEDGDNDEVTLEHIFGLRNSNRLPLEVQPIPELILWKQQFFREQWTREDHPSDPYSLHQLPIKDSDLPIIDPDLIGLDDLRNPDIDAISGADYFNLPTAAYWMWIGRNNWLDNAVFEVLNHPDNWTPKGMVRSSRDFKVDGDLTSTILSGDTIKVTGSTGNDGVYTVVAVTLDSGDSVIEVAEIIPSATLDGSITYLTRKEIIEISSSASATGQFIVAADLTGLVGVNDRVMVRSTGAFYGGNYRTYTINIVLSGPFGIQVVEDVQQDTWDYAILEFETTSAILDLPQANSGEGLITVVGDVTTDFIGGSVVVSVSGSNGNDGDYVIEDSSTDIDDLYSSYTVFKPSTIVPFSIEGGKLSYSLVLDILAVNLGARTFIVNAFDLSPFIADNDTFYVVFSTNEGEYTANGVPSFVDGTTRIVVDEPIESNEANGSVRLVFSDTTINPAGDPDLITVNNENLTSLIFSGDVIVLNQLSTVGVYSFTVQAVSLNGSGHTEITVSSPLDLTATTTDEVHLFFPITGIDTSGKYFEVAEDRRSRIFPEAEIVVSGTTSENDKAYTVERVSYDVVNVKSLVYVQEFIAEDTGDDGTVEFTVTRDISISKPIVPLLIEKMKDVGLTTFTNSNGDAPWDTSISLTSLTTLIDELKKGINMDENIAIVNDDINLSLDAFLEWVRIATKDNYYESGISDQPVTEDEWADFLNILVSAIKKNRHADWISEEIIGGIKLNPDTFWISERQPKDGVWPLPKENGVPLIDPDSISLIHLPEWAAGTVALSLFDNRKLELTRVRDLLYTSAIGTRSEDIIRFVFGTLMEHDDSALNLIQLLNDINSVGGSDSGESVSATAKRIVQDELLLSVEDFTVLMDVFTRMDAQGYQANDEDRQFYIPLLVSVYKRKRLYSRWADEENAHAYYELRKAQLPKWRATSQQRTVWQNALKQRSEMPVVDPDVVFPEDFRTYVSSDPGYVAYQTWTERRGELDDIQDVIDSIEPLADDTIKLNQRIRYVLALPTDTSFQEIIDLEKSGVNIKPRLDQLTLSVTSYRRLIQLIGLADTGTDNLLDSEWDEISAILLNVQKRRRYAAWKDEEVLTNITLSQSFFKLNKNQFYNYSLIENRLKKYRADFKERKDWQQTLQVRVENVDKEALSLDTIVRKTEEQVLPFLRDTLIQTVGDNDKLLEDNAKALSDRFLFDFQVNCCQHVTRVSQAMETLQQILWTERTGILDDNTTALPFTMVAPYFEDEWQWIGSYASWRSAMFVFLFPENLLYPTLRRYQSPGFMALTKQLQGSNRITPETACKAAKVYSSHLEDIANLKLLATCNALTMVHSGNCDNRFVKNYRCMFYTFAKSVKSNKIYFSVGQQGTSDPTGQGFWTEIEALGTNCLKIFGAVPHKLEDGQRFIFIMALVKEDGERKLACLRYDLDRLSWDGEYNPLDLPEPAKNPGDYDIVVEQRIQESEPIRVIVKDAMQQERWAKKGYPELKKMGYNELNAKGDGWKDEDWSVAANILPWPIAERHHSEERGHVKLLCWLRTGNDWGDYAVLMEYRDVFYVSVPSLQIYGSLPLNICNYGNTNSGSSEPVIFLGASAYPYNTGGFTIFYKRAYGGGYYQARCDFSNVQSWHSHVSEAEGITLEQAKAFIEETWVGDTGWEEDEPWERLTEAKDSVELYIQNNIDNVPKEIGLSGNELNGLKFLAPNSGKVEPFGKSGEAYLHACEFEGTSGIQRFRMKAVEINGPIYTALLPSPGSMLRITPIIPGPFDLVSRLTSMQLLFRKSMVQTVYDLNVPERAEILGEYVHEAYYFIPMYIGLQLQQRGHYKEALDWFQTVYDYRMSDIGNRKMYPGLVNEELVSPGYMLSPNWLQDPLNPHGIALTRANSYTKYTLLSIIRCMEDYADSEFTIDTAETVPRARELYKQAIEMLALPELALLEDQCHCGNKVDDIIRRIACELPVRDMTEWRWAIELMEDDLQRIQNCELSDEVIDGIVDRLLEDVTDMEEFDMSANVEEAQEYLNGVLDELDGPDTIAVVLDHEQSRSDALFDNVMADAGVEEANSHLSGRVRTDYMYGITQVLGIAPSDATENTYAFLLEDKASGQLPSDFSVAKQSAPYERWAPPGAPTHASELNLISNKFSAPASAWAGDYPEGVYVPILSNYYCVPDNPVITGLRLRAELNLFKIRNCMNIAGMTRSLDPYAAPTDTTSGIPVIGPGGQLSLPGSARITPTPYRYQVIIERAKQLVNYAQQVEANFLAALEKRDAEYYNRMKAKQDLSLSKANVTLQKLRVKVSEGEVDMAELQRERAELQVSELQGMIDEGLLGEEDALVGMHISYGVLKVMSTVFGTALSASSANTFLAAVAGAASSAKSAVDSVLIGLETSISVTQIYAAQARREQEWQFQQNLANKDVQIGNQGIKVAQSRLRVSGQEQKISELQVEHAEATVDFLTNKFTNVELYDFMGETLEGVYSYFLQQATATAKMAMNQLAFERQELPPAFIVDDYWQVPTDSAAVATVGSNAPDRRGITGSARLLQDMIKLDQYSFDTDKRKLQMSKTFSLSSLAPMEFQQFKTTGVMNFQTMMEYFDRDFPGQFLRLIKKVRVSVIALTPPTEGIKATLTSSGTSRVVIGGDIFQTIIARREPEMIAFTGTRDATGMFEMQAENQFLNPFEGSGVDMLWEFKMRREANLFNYSTIADVLITIEYTALHNYNYQQQVLRQLPPFHSADRPFSFRSELADQFYELGHPDEELQTENSTVEFTLVRGHFPPNIVELRISEFKLLFVTENGSSINDLALTDDLPVTINLEEHASNGELLSLSSNTATIGSNNIISTTSGAAGLASALRGKSPEGKWKINVPNVISELIRNEKILDIMMVFTYTGDYPTTGN